MTKRIKRNVKLPDNIITYLQWYANNTETIKKIMENEELEQYFDLGEFQESSFSCAESIASKLCELCNIKGTVDKQIVQAELEYAKEQQDKRRLK